MANAEYTVEDLIRAYNRAIRRGPDAEAAFKAELNRASFRILELREPVNVACFNLMADDSEGRENA